MVKLCKKLFYLTGLLSILAVCVIVFAPYGKEYAYGYKPIGESEDGNKLGWVHERLRRPIDYAFIGSSHTLRGIDDGFIEEAVAKSEEHALVQVTNSGRNWPGRNLDYLMVKELLERRKPRAIFLEVTEKLPLGGHVLFPILAESGDIFAIENLGNLRLASDLQTAFKSRFDSLVAAICKCDVSRERSFRYKKYGYLAVDGVLDDKGIAAGVSDGKGMVEKHLPLVYRALCRFNFIFEANYLEKITKLAKQKGVRIAFIYIPSYGSHEIPEVYRKTAGQYEILMPPAGIFDSAANYADIGHLNAKGSRELSTWIADKIVADLKRFPKPSASSDR